MIVRPWRKGDEKKIVLQAAQRYLRLDDLENFDLSAWAEQGYAQTGEVDGEVMAIIGVMPMWPGRAIAWAYISENAGKHFPVIHRHVKKFLDNCGIRRIEATVDVGFPEGCRWMKMLGFEIEGHMKAYRPDGADVLLYARVRP